MAKSIKVALTLDNTGFRRGISQAEKSVKKFEQSGKAATNSLMNGFKALAGAFAAREFISFADSATVITNRLKAVTSSSAEAASAFGLIQDVAQSSRSDLDAVTALFAGLTIATEGMGKSQEDVAKIAETFSKSLKVSGADAAAASGAIRQFGQALGSGVLRGDEFNSIMEANPKFMQDIAKQLGVTTGKLREYAEEGLLTADVITAATEDMAGRMDTAYGKTNATIGESFTLLKNNATAAFIEIDNGLGITSGFSNAIQALANNLDIAAAATASFMTIAFGPAAVARVVAMTAAMKAFALSNPFTAIALGVTTLIAGLVSAYRSSVTFRNALATAGNIGIDVINSLINGFKAFSGFVSDIMPNIGRAIADGLNPWSDASFVDTFKQGFENSFREAQATMNGAGPITARFELEPVDTGPIEQPVVQGTTDDPAVGSKAKAALDASIAANEAAKEKKKLDTEASRAQDRLLDQITRNAQTLKDRLADEKASLQNQLDMLELETSMVGLSDREKENKREIAALEAKRLEAEKEISALQLSTDPVENLAMQQEAIAKLNAEYAAYIEQIKAARQENYTTATSFSAGWEEAFENFSERVKDNAAYGAKLFNTMTEGFSTAILNFVETGKLSFKDLFKSLMTEIIKMQANRLFLSIFGALGAGGGGGIFAGLFNKGGYIPAGQFGIAGERGPEIVNGPASVTSTADTARMLGGSRTTVNYNINAVDAPSFKALVASDPEFIYNVTRVGQRRLPA